MTQSPSLPAKRPRSIVAGPYGHPFHPVLVTIPIGTWTASLVFDLIGLGADDPRPFAVGAFWLLVIGLVGAVLAAVLGLLDFSTIPGGTKAHRTALTHLALNSVALLLFLVDVLVRNAHGQRDVSVTGLVLTVVGLVVVGVSGTLGATLAYHFGVRVADEGTQAEGFR
jgi:uncharacterized membrane protein